MNVFVMITKTVLVRKCSITFVTMKFLLIQVLISFMHMEKETCLARVIANWAWVFVIRHDQIELSNYKVWLQELWFLYQTERLHWNIWLYNLFSCLHMMSLGQSALWGPVSRCVMRWWLLMGSFPSVHSAAWRPVAGMCKLDQVSPLRPGEASYHNQGWDMRPPVNNIIHHTGLTSANIHFYLFAFYHSILVPWKT